MATPEEYHPKESTDQEKDPFDLAITRFGHMLFGETYDSDVLYASFLGIVNAITIKDMPEEYEGQKKERRRATALMAQFGSMRSRNAGDFDQSARFTGIQERFEDLANE